MLLTSAYVRVPSSSVMETAAKNFLNSLTPEQRAKATYKFEDDQRFDWHFIPKPRKGLPLREMTTFLRTDDGSWRRDDERHDNVLIDTAALPDRLAALGLNAEVRSAFGTETLPEGLMAVVAQRPG